MSAILFQRTDWNLAFFEDYYLEIDKTLSTVYKMKGWNLSKAWPNKVGPAKIWTTPEDLIRFVLNSSSLKQDFGIFVKLGQLSKQLIF